MKRNDPIWFVATAPNGAEWVGHVDLDAPPGQDWSFQLVKQVTIQELYANPFDKVTTIIGLLDLQEPATLLKPFVHRIAPGSLNVAHVAIRTRLEGSMLGVLSGVAVSDPTMPLFTSVSFESSVFRSWLAPPLAETGPVGAVDVSIDSDEPLAGVGRIIFRGATKSGQDLWSRTMRTAAIFAIAFDTPKSLDETTRLCFALDRLFCFLIGFRAKPPEFSLEQASTPDAAANPPARLRLGGAQWLEDEPPFWLNCIHARPHGGPPLPKLVGTFLEHMDDFLAAFDAVETARFFSNDIVASFKTVMPVLERLLKQRFTLPEEQKLLDLKESFWEWFDQAADPAHREFARKHLNSVDSKAPALTTLLKRAVAEINAKGFVVPESMAVRIKDRRARIFHSNPQLVGSDDALSFALEARAANLLLLLLTLSALGIDLAQLATRPEALRDFTMFFKRPDPKPSPDTRSMEASDEG